MQSILGISAFYHDSAAALVTGETIQAAAQEERFSRIKHDQKFPVSAVQYVLESSGIDPKDIAAVAFYDKPFLKFERLLESSHETAPRGLRSFITSMPVWIKEKLFMKDLLIRELRDMGFDDPTLLFPEHHLSHAASAFYPSPYDKAAILTIDGVGEWATTTIGLGDGQNIELLKQINFPHSLGLLYSAFTHYCGFKVNSGEYKLMGLAPYGNSGPETDEMVQKIQENLIRIQSDGSFTLNLDYFDYVTGQSMTVDSKWMSLFGLKRRTQESEISQPYANMALAIQTVTEHVVKKLARHARDLTGCQNLVMAGGVALNCVANGKLLRENIFSNLWIQPAAGDAGGALGAAMAAQHIWADCPRTASKTSDKMSGSYLGPSIDSNAAVQLQNRYGAHGTQTDSASSLCEQIAAMLADGKIVGWCQGRMEFGPRALGARSILGDPRNPEMQKNLNLKIKYRESFRPFAPSVLSDSAGDYFELDGSSPYMLLVAPVLEKHHNPELADLNTQDMRSRLYHLRSSVPAITHIDYSARVQTVHQETNPTYWQLIKSFQELTGIPMVVNTSFNVRGEPIVCTHFDAYQCFMRTEMDVLVINQTVYLKSDQPPWDQTDDWREEFTLD